MKKLLVIAVAMIMVFAMASCGGGEESPYTGTYKATTAEYAGIELEVDSLFPDGFSITLENGGKCSVDVEGEVDTGRWEETEGVIIIDGELEFTVDLETGVGTMEYEGVVLNFEKQ